MDQRMKKEHEQAYSVAIHTQNVALNYCKWRQVAFFLTSSFINFLVDGQVAIKPIRNTESAIRQTKFHCVRLCKVTVTTCRLSVKNLGIQSYRNKKKWKGRLRYKHFNNYYKYFTLGNFYVSNITKNTSSMEFK